jgi:hypothetical protein
MVLIALLVAACEGGSGSGDGRATPGQDRPSNSLGGLERPPDLVVTAGDEQLVLGPFTYCWSVGDRGVCADGAPPDPLPSLTLESGSDLIVDFPLRWEIQATLLPDGDHCEGVVVDVDPIAPSVDTLGPAGMYLVEVFGRGEQGDAAWSFELITTEDRPGPPGYMQAFWFPSERALEATAPFGAQLGNLTEKPNNAAAVATVIASDGNSEDFTMTTDIAGDCWGSAISLQGPEDFTNSVLGLGPPPYEVVVKVTLDDRDVVGQAITWPGDYPSNSNESRRVPLQSASK